MLKLGTFSEFIMQGVIKVLFQKSNFFGKNLQSKKSIRDLLVYIIPGNRGAVCEGHRYLFVNFVDID